MYILAAIYTESDIVDDGVETFVADVALQELFLINSCLRICVCEEWLSILLQTILEQPRGSVDHVFVNSEATCELVDSELNRTSTGAEHIRRAPARE